ncbi:hypothetical protein N7454_007051 [Penicillium verhagenii]|nr:hypothetical protein N7454_007051 [Penicillium verhagenii]
MSPAVYHLLGVFESLLPKIPVTFEIEESRQNSKMPSVVIEDDEAIAGLMRYREREQVVPGEWAIGDYIADIYRLFIMHTATSAKDTALSKAIGHLLSLRRSLTKLCSRREWRARPRMA